MAEAPRLLRISNMIVKGTEYWLPINDQQYTAIKSPAQMLLFGGASGGGKTDYLVADAAREHDNPNFRGLLIRRSYTEMPQIIDRTRAIYSQMGATYRGDGGVEHHLWKFPSGAQLRLGYISEKGDIGRYQGNPFTWLGVDESTYLRERSVRDILPWLISTDPAIKCRVRLTTNPGQIGADWHMRVFLQGKCPVHFPDESVVPGIIYEDSTWQDGKPTNLSTSFIPSLATDNPLYGQEKIDRLESQTAENAEKLLRGCWCALEGAYYKYLRPFYMLPLVLAEDAWWKQHIISIDYGFGGSWAAAGLYVISEPSVDFPEGRLWKIGELVRSEVGSADFAEMVVEAFIKPYVGEQRRQFDYAVLDPATDAHTGTGKSNFDFIRDVLEEYRIPCIKAAKDRIGNFQNLYRMMKTGPLDKPELWKPGQLVITDACPITFSSLCTRIHDPAKPGDIKKMDGDPKDDLLDETSYGANTFFSTSEKPKEVAMHAKLKEYKESGMDEHSLLINTILMQRENAQSDQPARLGRTRGIVKR